jgi:multidrug efflux pump
VVGFVSEDGSMDRTDIADYVVDEHRRSAEPRAEGVGSVQVFGGKYAMRIWLDPAKLATYALTPADMVGRDPAQNAQVAAGQLGGTPAVDGQQINATITAQDRLQTPEQFRAIVLRSEPTARCCAGRRGARRARRRELRASSAATTASRRPAWRSSLATGANALDTAKAVARSSELAPSFPPG